MSTFSRPPQLLPNQQIKSQVVALGGMMEHIVLFSTFTSILSLREGEEEKNRMSLQMFLLDSIVNKKYI